VFTGIIEEIGRIKNIRSNYGNSLLEIQAQKVISDAKIGSSIAVNGICLTVVEIKKTGFIAEVIKETLLRSNLSGIKTGQSVNLERPLKANGSFDGHIVMGHADGTGKIREIKKEKGSWLATVEISSGLAVYIVNKGSIAVDGISLTVTECKGDIFTLNVIPHTIENTTLKERISGDKVNIEVDVIAKYAEKISAKKTEKKELTKEFLNENGYTV